MNLNEPFSLALKIKLHILYIISSFFLKPLFILHTIINKNTNLMPSDIITKEIAICMLFNEPYDLKVACRLLKHIEEFGDLEICHEHRKPNEPILVSKKRMEHEPCRYLLYPRVSRL